MFILYLAIIGNINTTSDDRVFKAREYQYYEQCETAGEVAVSGKGNKHKHISYVCVPTEPLKED